MTKQKADNSLQAKAMMSEVMKFCLLFCCKAPRPVVSFSSVLPEKSAYMSCRKICYIPVKVRERGAWRQITFDQSQICFFLNSLPRQIM